MSRVAAREWGEFGITVNIVCPLAMTERLAQWAEAEPEMAKANLKNIALGRYGDPEKILTYLPIPCLRRCVIHYWSHHTCRWWWWNSTIK